MVIKITKIAKERVAHTHNMHHDGSTLKMKKAIDELEKGIGKLLQENEEAVIETKFKLIL